MDNKRIFLSIALVLVVLQLWAAWQHDYPPPAAKMTVTEGTNNAQNTNGQSQANVPAVPADVPVAANTVMNATSNNVGSNTTTQANANTTTAATSATNDSSAATNLINVDTDVLHVTIDPVGGNIIGSALLKYPAEINQPHTPMTLLSNNSDDLYRAESGLTGKQGPDSADGQVRYLSEQTKYQMVRGQKTLDVSLHWENSQGLRIVKTFSFTANSYAISVQYKINNTTHAPWTGYFYTQLTRKPVPPMQKGLFRTVTYLGAAISSPDQLYEKIPFTTMAATPLDRKINGGWAAMVQHYFVSAWVPGPGEYHYYSKDNDGIYTLGMLSPALIVQPATTATIGARLYSGPEVMSSLRQLAPGLDETVDYGKLWFISLAIFWLMSKIYAVVGNWGWSIVLVTLVIKLLFFHLSATSYRSMAKMRLVQPRIALLKERHGADKQKFSQELWKIYKTEKINPLNGCLPMLVQIPVFLGLYWVLIESVELRQAPFIFWIHDLSAKDPYYILPLLMGLSMFIQQKMNPAPPDPTQAKVMMFLPIFFTILFMTFPAGLVLYWLVNNTLSILQQWYIMRQIPLNN